MMMSEDDRGTKARAFFDGLWRQGDYWRLETSPFELAKYDRQLHLISDRTYQSILEIGCGGGAFTRRLGTLAPKTLGVDIAEAALSRAALDCPAGVEFRLANVMDLNFGREGPWDLIVMSETVYYLGWLYPFFDVTWLAEELVKSTTANGRLLMANSYGNQLGDLLAPAAIRTYHDLFENCGFRKEHEEVFRGEKDGVPVDSLISLFVKPNH